MTRLIAPIIACLVMNLNTSCNSKYDDYYANCNQRMGACPDGEGEYCLYGYAWGLDKSFSPYGTDVTGPQLTNTTITYSFKPENTPFSSHRQSNLQSFSFEVLPGYAKEYLRKAFCAWGGVANINFKEVSEKENSDLKILIGDIHVAGIGFPNIKDQNCSEIAGNILLSKDLKTSEKHFYSLVLHEIGHSLGLGHVKSDNVMNPDKNDRFKQLQKGDSLGIIALYGKKEIDKENLQANSMSIGQIKIESCGLKN